MKRLIAPKIEARTLVLQPIGAGLYVMPDLLTKENWLSCHLADVPAAESLSGFAPPSVENFVFTVHQAVVVLVFDKENDQPVVAGVPSGSYLPPSLVSEHGQKIDAIYHAALRQLSLPVNFFRGQGAIYANLEELEPGSAASIGYHVASDDVSLPSSWRYIPVGKADVGLPFPGKTFDELKIHGVIAKCASGYDGTNLYLLQFWVAEPSKAGMIHPFLSRLAPGTEVWEGSVRREDIPEAYVRLPMSQLSRFSKIGGPVFLNGEELICNPLDLILADDSGPIHGLRAILSYYSPCSIFNADRLLRTIVSSGDSAAIEHGSSVAIGRNLFFKGRFCNLQWEKDSSEPF